MSYIAEYKIPYEGGYVDLPSEETPEMAEFINKRDDTLLKIEKYLSELDLSGLGGDYALLSEAGYSINVSIDENYILSISLLNKEGMTLSARTIDLPIESMVVNASYESGKLILTLQNGQTIEVDISDMVRGLVPTSRKIAGIDLEDDISASELQEALGILDNATAAGEIKSYVYKKDEETLCGVYMGKPLYRNVVWIPSLGNKETIQVPVSSVIENVLKLDGYNYFADGEVIPMDNPRRDAGTSNDVVVSIRYVKSINSITIQSFRDRTNVMGFVVFEYTKSTDDANSGDKLNPYGIYDAKIDDLNEELEAVKNSIATTSEATLQNSHKGRLLFNKIKGASVQNGTPTIDSQIDIETSVISSIRTFVEQLFNKDTITEGYTINANSGNPQANEYFALSDFIRVDASTYYCISQSNSVYFQYIWAFYNKEKEFISTGSHNASSSTKEYSFVTPDNAHYTRISYSINVSGSPVDRGNIMFNKGITALPWEPYYESLITLSQPIELYGMGNVQDVITPNHVKRKYRYFKLTSNLIGTVDSYSDTTRFVIGLGGIASNGIPNCLMCNIAQAVSSGSNANTCRLYSSGQIFLFLDADYFPDKNSFISYLENNDVYFVYGLAEETTEEIPLADQIALNSLQTFDGITYLEFDSEIKPIHECEYGTTKNGGYTLESLLTARNNDLRLSALETSVVNNI